MWNWTIGQAGPCVHRRVITHLVDHFSPIFDWHVSGASPYVDTVNNPETCLAGDVEVASLRRERGDGSLDRGLLPEQNNGLVDEVVVCPVDLSKGVSGDHNVSEEIEGGGSIPSITRAGILEGGHVRSKLPLKSVLDRVDSHEQPQEDCGVDCVEK
jgi:hypothetical protein